MGIPGDQGKNRPKTRGEYQRKGEVPLTERDLGPAGADLVIKLWKSPNEVEVFKRAFRKRDMRFRKSDGE